ncbi:MAG: CDP-diacylglycerol--glycerol-3-phosphate 3-phosphatidyltransferase [Leptolyngbyaceae cyanobacterium SL_7_1]|nr:CDP-diacylglycerol--glycerol-3-phosphate 3-phosphatidyltransferase [Leptolyngbyaceae cyanobacterium SL_7_1]
MSHVPAALIALRVLIAPLLVWDAIDGSTSLWFVVGYAIAFLSDILDGVVARRLQISTAQLRQADSAADVCLYLAVYLSAWLAHRELVVALWIPILAAVMAQAIWLVVNVVKYGKPASYHTYSARLWGVTLAIATIALFGFDQAGLWIWIAAIVGVIHSFEEIAMTLVLPEWQHDVWSLYHALELRNQGVGLE